MHFSHARKIHFEAVCKQRQSVKENKRESVYLTGGRQCLTVTWTKRKQILHRTLLLRYNEISSSTSQSRAKPDLRSAQLCGWARSHDGRTIHLKHPVPPLAAVIKIHYSQVAPKDTLPFMGPALNRLLLTWPLNLGAVISFGWGSEVAMSQFVLKVNRKLHCFCFV